MRQNFIKIPFSLIFFNLQHVGRKAIIVVYYIPVNVFNLSNTMENTKEEFMREKYSLNSSSNDANFEKFKNEIRDFSIGRERLKMLCLLDPELAKFGIDIDSGRARFHLLVNDICDLALMNETVASHILDNAKLENNRRLQGGFSSIICKYYPNLTLKLFSLYILTPPAVAEIVKLITTNPHLFSQLLTKPKFKNLINKAKTLVDLSLINEEIALSVLEQSNHFSKFDRYWYATSVGIKFEKVALQLIQNQAWMKQLGNEDFFELANAHAISAQFVFNKLELIKELKLDEKQLTRLKATAIQNLTTLRLAIHDTDSILSCLPKELIQHVANNYFKLCHQQLFFQSTPQEKADNIAYKSPVIDEPQRVDYEK